MAGTKIWRAASDLTSASINDTLCDDLLRNILSKMGSEKDKEVFGLICKSWLNMQSTARRKIFARTGGPMLRRIGERYPLLAELDFSRGVLSFGISQIPTLIDADLFVIANWFPCLRVLNFKFCQGITNLGLEAIGSSLSSLQCLDLSYTGGEGEGVSNKGISAIAKGCPDLRSLHLAECGPYITDKALVSLSNNCHNLEQLGLGGCYKITDYGLSTLVSGCGRINYLDLENCTCIGDLGISILSKTCSSFLRTLRLFECYISNESISSLAYYCKNLETVSVAGCSVVSDESLRLLASSCTNSLRNLRLDWCFEIKDSTVNYVLSKCTSLVALDITGCEEVTDAAFEGLVTCHNDMPLRILNVRCCPKITVSGIAMLSDSCKYLEYLDVRLCPLVTEDAWGEAGLGWLRERWQVIFTGSIPKNEVVI